MALECVCFPLVDPRMMSSQKQGGGGHCQDPKQKEPLDLCEIVKRTQAYEQEKHDDRECHLKGEKRQNIINKLKMFLDDCDDRPVLKRSGGGGGSGGSGSGRGNGYGPLIKYPGYVDYEHPYFSQPYDKLPELATTVGQRPGVNPCPPISVRNWDASSGAATATGAGVGRGRGQRGGGGADGCCRCAQRREVPPKCPAACQRTPAPPTQGHPQAGSGRGGRVVEPANGGLVYFCTPLPQN